MKYNAYISMDTIQRGTKIHFNWQAQYTVGGSKVAKPAIGRCECAIMNY